MTRKVVATPLFARRLKELLDEYAELGVVRLVERFQQSYQAMVKNIPTFDKIAPARRRSVHDKKITVREYVLDAGARNFLVLNWVSPDPVEPILLLNIRIGGQNRFCWKEEPH